MKKVIIDKDSATVSIKSVTSTKYYGVSWGDKKGFITRENYRCDCFILVDSKGLTKNARTFNIDAPTLKECFNNAIDAGLDVYEFDTAKELFSWLSE